jgi:hypothetical protein
MPQSPDLVHSALSAIAPQNHTNGQDGRSSDDGFWNFALPLNGSSQFPASSPFLSFKDGIPIVIGSLS